jgi:hypothetical protein
MLIAQSAMAAAVAVTVAVAVVVAVGVRVARTSSAGFLTAKGFVGNYCDFYVHMQNMSLILALILLA